MSDFTDFTEDRAAEAAPDAGTAGRHRGPTAHDDQAERLEAAGQGRHRRPLGHGGPLFAAAGE